MDTHRQPKFRVARPGKTGATADTQGAANVRRAVVMHTAGHRDPPRPNGPAFERVALLVHEVSCEKTTKEVDRDEIALAGVAIVGELRGSGQRAELVGKARKGHAIDAGKFSKGTTERYKSPRVLVELPFGAAALPWPRTFSALLLLVEKDEGAIGAAVDQIVEKVDDELVRATKAAAATAGSAIASSVLAGTALGSAVPLVGNAIGAAAGAAVGAALGAIQRSRKDDVFPPEHVRIELAAPPAKGGDLAGSRRVVRFAGHNGRYKVVCSWRVV